MRDPSPEVPRSRLDEANEATVAVRTSRAMSVILDNERMHRGTKDRPSSYGRSSAREDVAGRPRCARRVQLHYLKRVICLCNGIPPAYRMDFRPQVVGPNPRDGDLRSPRSPDSERSRSPDH